MIRVADAQEVGLCDDESHRGVPWDWRIVAEQPARHEKRAVDFEEPAGFLDLEHLFLARDADVKGVLDKFVLFIGGGHQVDPEGFHDGLLVELGGVHRSQVDPSFFESLNHKWPVT